MFIWILVHLRNPINARQTGLVTICLYSEGSEDRLVAVQHFWCRTNCQIVCGVSRKWKESKFFDQNIEVVSLANKERIIGCFVGINYCKTRLLSAQFILALLAHSFICAKISSVLHFHIVYVHKTYGDSISLNTKTIKFCIWQYSFTEFEFIVHTEDILHVVNVRCRQNQCNLIICDLICFQNKSKRSIVLVTGRVSN